MTDPGSTVEAPLTAEAMSRKRKVDEISSSATDKQQPLATAAAEPANPLKAETSEKVQSDKSTGTTKGSCAMEVEPAAQGSGTGEGEGAKPTAAAATAANTTSETSKPATDTPVGADAHSCVVAGHIPENDKNDYSRLRWIVVRNDGKPESMMKLIGLKSLFAKQLPKMPRAYIARLVLDRRHTSLAILSDKPEVKDSDEEIIGGICFRAFDEMRFAEIAFCAVSATHQVKGYGSKLMNLLKKISAETGIENLITYADNYAIGYFKKQGFSKSISMPKGRYFGLIKEYDGGTPMECYVHPSIDYTRVPAMLRAQREFILKRVRLTSNSHKVYDALPKGFSSPSGNGSGAGATTNSVLPTIQVEGMSARANATAVRALAIPGIAQAGWTLADLRNATGQGKDVDRQKTVLKTDLLAMLRKIEEQQYAWPFREPVDTNEVPDYLDVIKEPVDLSLIEKRIRDNFYRNQEMFFADLILMTNNCKTYNDEASTYVECATKLEKFVNDKLRRT